MQTCQNSTTNSKIEVNFYQNETGTTYAPIDILVDSTSNLYLAYSRANEMNILITKIATNGTYTWTKEYEEFHHLKRTKRMMLSRDETILRMLSVGDNYRAQL